MNYTAYGSTYEIEWYGKTITVKREVKNGWGNGPLVLQHYSSDTGETETAWKDFENHMSVLQENVKEDGEAQADFMVRFLPGMNEAKKKTIFSALRKEGLKLKTQLNGFLCFERTEKAKPIEWTAEDSYRETRKKIAKDYAPWTSKGMEWAS